MQSQRTRRRHGLTLIELVVVLAVLTALAALVIPRVVGIMSQSSTAAGAAILQGISEAEGRFEAQYNKIPSGWDGVLDASGTMYTKLHPNLLKQLDSAGTAITAGTLTAMQAQSLTDAGMAGIHMQDTAWTGVPSDSGRTWQTIAESAKVAMLVLPTSVTAANFSTYGHNVLFPDRAFSITPYSPALWNSAYVVVGFGNETSLKRNAVQDTPLFSSVNPGQYYARGLCVFRVPNSSVTNISDAGYFKAQYVGCIAPDGTSLADNLKTYSQGQATN